MGFRDHPAVRLTAITAWAGTAVGGGFAAIAWAVRRSAARTRGTDGH